jgi:hypothetical protein
MTNIPDSVKATLWSFDTSKIDLNKDKDLIINHVLNFGTSKATDWLFSNYSKEDILPLIQNPKPGFWNKKSLNLWAIIFKVEPNLKDRF